MYYLSKICCFCLQNNVKLQHLHKTTYHGTPIIDIIKIIIDDMVLSEPNHDFFICGGCTKRVEEMYTFRQTSITNNRVLSKYIHELRTFGGEFWNIRVEIDDVMKRTDLGVLDTSRVDDEIDPSNVLSLQYDNFEGVNEIKVETEENAKDPFETNEFFNPYGFHECVEIKNEPPDDFGDGDSGYLQETYENEAAFGENEYEDPTDSSVRRADVQTETVNALADLIRADKKTYDCSKCGKVFNLKKHLIIHLKEHKNKKNFKCETCGKIFPHKSELNVHAVIHSEAKPYKCETCGKPLSHKFSLRYHNLIHSGEKPYKCEICGLGFYLKGSLKDHAVIHSGKKSFKCNVCDKSFSHMRYLKTHYTIHTREKPLGRLFDCTVCHKSYSHPSNLRRHMLVHEKDTAA